MVATCIYIKAGVVLEVRRDDEVDMISNKKK